MGITKYNCKKQIKAGNRQSWNRILTTLKEIGIRITSAISKGVCKMRFAAHLAATNYKQRRSCYDQVFRKSLNSQNSIPHFDCHWMNYFNTICGFQYFFAWLIIQRNCILSTIYRSYQQDVYGMAGRRVLIKLRITQRTSGGI